MSDLHTHTYQRDRLPDYHTSTLLESFHILGFKAQASGNGNLIYIQTDATREQSDELVTLHTGAAAPLRLWAYIANPNAFSAESVNFTSMSDMKEALEPSVEINLRGRVTQIDWLAPDQPIGPLDPFNERFTGTPVVREKREWTEGTLGPLRCVYTFEAIREDGTVGATWQRQRTFKGRMSKDKGDTLRKRTYNRLSTWAAAGAYGVAVAQKAANPSTMAAMVLSAWGSSHKEAIIDFIDNGNARPLVRAFASSEDAFLDVPASSLAIHVVGGDAIDPAGTVRDALVTALSAWAL